MKKYNREESVNASIKYFNGDVLAANVWVDKYSLKDADRNIYELTPDDMHKRLAKEIARIENKYQNSLSEEELYNLFKNFKYIVPQGGSMAGIGNNFVMTSLSNCFVIPQSEDSYAGIMKTDQEQIQMMRRRGGVGHDLSTLRPQGAIANGSKLKGNTGATLYMERFSNSTREVAQDSRRGALMLSIDIKHPDAEKFIDMKIDTTKVTGANISVRINDKFMASVLHDFDFYQTFPIDLKITSINNYLNVIENLEYDELVTVNDVLNSKNELINVGYIKKINAKKLWNKIIHNAWKSAEPGILFWDTILNESPAKGYGEEWKESCTNPCFTGDTVVAVADGNNGIPISELAKNGDKFLVYSARKNNSSGTHKGGWKTEIKEAIAFKTGNKKVIKIILSDGSSFKCTPDHKLALPNGKYIEAKDSLRLKLEILNNSLKNIFVEKIIDLDNEDVYDLTVEDNHNFYIITKTDDDKYLNCSGILVHNCGEVPLNQYDSCRLLAINLYSYVKNPFAKEAKFDFDLFKSHAKKAQRIMDDIIDLEIEKLDVIINKIKSDPESDEIKYVELNLWKNVRKRALQGRRTGLGITAEGDMLAALNLRYGSEKATNFSEEVHKQLAISVYESSIEMAKERGNFIEYDYSKEIPFESSFLKRIYSNISKKYQEMWNEYGRRNIACLTIAPTGTTSLMTQTTSGIEPIFMPFYKRRRKTEDIKKSIFVDEVGDMWEEYMVIHSKFKEWFEINKIGFVGIDKLDLEDLSEEEIHQIYMLSPYYNATSNDVDYLGKVEMQGNIQKWIDHSISVTINMPNKVTEEIVNKVYTKAWESGCKGVTVYRDGSRAGVLIPNSENKNDEIIYNDAPRRPKELPVDIYHKIALGKEFTILVGILKGKPYEIFAFEQLSNVDFPNEIEKGTLTRIRKNHYRLIGYRKEHKYAIENIIEKMNEDEQFQTRDFSRGLRHGEHPKYICNDIDKSSYISSFRKVVSRVLKNYLTNTDVSDKCPNCGNKLKFESGCKHCGECGWSACS